eukprot:2225638-Rhodomonas_salina.1
MMQEAETVRIPTAQKNEIAKLLKGTEFHSACNFATLKALTVAGAKIVTRKTPEVIPKLGARVEL